MFENTMHSLLSSCKIWYIYTHVNGKNAIIHNCGFLQYIFCILSCSYIILLNISKYHLNWKLFEKTKLSFKKKSRKDTRRLLEDLWWGIKFSEKKSGKNFCQNWWGKPRKSRRILFSKIFDHPNSVRTLLHSTFFGKFLVQCCCCFFFFDIIQNNMRISVLHVQWDIHQTICNSVISQLNFQ